MTLRHKAVFAKKFGESRKIDKEKTKRLGPPTPKINTIKGILRSRIFEPTINP